MTGVRVGALMLALLLASCSSSHEPGDGAVDGGVDANPDEPREPLDPLTFEAMHRQARCRAAIRCESRGADFAQRVCHPTSAEGPPNPKVLAVEDGRMTFDAEAARRCLERLLVSCEELMPGWWFPSVCRNVYRGAVADGEACAAEAECAVPGSTCVVVGSCPGRCGPGPDLGEPCGRGARCRGPYRCSIPTGGIGSCHGRTAGEACDWSHACGEGLFCDPSGLCSALRLSGEPCGLVDDRALLPFLRECDRGLLCVPVGDQRMCKPAAAASDGDPCITVFDSCPDPFVCGGVDFSTETFGRCTVGAVAGERCDDMNPCALGYRCAEGRCVHVIGPGEACDAERHCPSSHHCREGRCEPLPIEGQPCDGSGGVCFRGRCDAGICALLPAGSACTRSWECETECIRGICTAPIAAGEPCDRYRSCPEGYTCRIGDDYMARCLPDCRLGW